MANSLANNDDGPSHFLPMVVDTGPDPGPGRSIESRTSLGLRSAISAKKQVMREAAALEHRLMHLRREAARSSKDAARGTKPTSHFDNTEHLKWREMAHASREAGKARTEQQRRINMTHKQINNQMTNLSRQGLLTLRRTEADKERRKRQELMEQRQNCSKRRIDERKLRAQQVRQSQLIASHKRQETQERFQEQMRMQRTERLRRDSDACTQASEALERMRFEERALMQQIGRAKALKHSDAAGMLLGASNSADGLPLPGMDPTDVDVSASFDPVATSVTLATIHFPVAKECRHTPQRNHNPALRTGRRTRGAPREVVAAAGAMAMVHPPPNSPTSVPMPLSPSAQVRMHLQAAAPVHTHPSGGPPVGKPELPPVAGGLHDPALPSVLSAEALPGIPQHLELLKKAERAVAHEGAPVVGRSPTNTTISLSLMTPGELPLKLELPDIPTQPLT